MLLGHSEELKNLGASIQRLSSIISLFLVSEQNKTEAQSLKLGICDFCMIVLAIMGDPFK